MARIAALNTCLEKALCMHVNTCKFINALDDYHAASFILNSAGHNTDAIDKAIKDVCDAINRLKDETLQVYVEFRERGIILDSNNINSANPH
jgi:hypothetical protein